MIKIMLVEDDPGVREVVNFLIEDPQCEVVTAESGQACLDNVRKGFRGLIFMDVMMPGLSGWQTIEKMSQEGIMEGNVVCMLTAVENPTLEVASLSKYILEYIPKPFTQAQLQKVIGLYRELVSAKK